MYSIVQESKNSDYGKYDHVFKDFSEYYRVADFLQVPFTGIYKLAVITSDVQDVQNFVANEKRYSHLSTDIYMEEAPLRNLTERNPEYNVTGKERPYDTFIQMIAERGLLFDRYVSSKLYRSIDHTPNAMMVALDTLREHYGQKELITLDKVSEYFVINDTIYPGQVLDKFLLLDKHRWKLLNMCLEQIDNDIVIGATVKELKRRVNAKAVYFKTGDANDRVKNMNTQNLILAYKTFVTERRGINDAYILYRLYESGLNVSEVQGGRNVSI